MSNWLSGYSGEDQKGVDELNAKGMPHKPTQKKDGPGFFSGSATAPLRGVAAGMVKTYETAAKPFRRIGDYVEYATDDYLSGGLDGPLDVRRESFEDVRAQKEKIRNDRFVTEIEQLEDHQNTGTLGNIGFGLGDYATRALIGSLGGGTVGAAFVSGTSESNYTYENLTNKGVDSDTALQVAAVDGVTAAVATALPMSYGFKGTGGLLKDGALAIGGATALSTGGQYASNQILESNDYNKQAKKYEVTGESFATDLLLNTLFFGAARGTRAYLDRGIDSELNDVRGTSDQTDVNLTLEQIEARETTIESALEVNRMQFEDSSAQFIPLDAVQQNNHLANIDTAAEQLRTGKPVNVPKNVQGTPKAKAQINYESMSLPDNAKAIARKAQQSNIDPSVALTIAQLESGFKHDAKNPRSTAQGLFQVLDRGWKSLGGKDRNSIDEQIRIGLKHIYEANKIMRKNLGRDPVAHEQYLGHLLGPSGASRVLKADPNAKIIDIVRKYDAQNADAIVNNNGMKGLTVGESITKWQKKWNTASARYGEPSKAYGMDGSSYDFAYEVKSLDDLNASNDAAFGVNPNYPAELQPRDRTRAASQQQVEEMANSLRPELLGESHKLSDGAPIVGLDNVVESGNGRTMAIRKAYETGKADEYRSYIDSYAREKGWDISGINNPVLVRTRLTDTDRVEFAKLANESDVAQFSSTERARSDADRLPDSSAVKINNDGTINLDGSMDFVHGFIDQLPQSERASAITSDGRLSQEGKRRIESAMVQRAYGDSNLVTRLSENLDDDSKTVLNALLRAAPQLAQLGDLVAQGGRHSNTLATDIAQAAQKLSDLKANGQTVKDYLSQGQLIDDGLSPGAKDFLSVFDTNNRSAKAIGEQIQSKINEIESQGDPRQGSLFGESIEEQQALEIIMRNPDQEISVSRTRPDGEVEEITMTLRERLDELEAEATAAKEQGVAAEAAANCALQFG